jgi:hypothetical protein
MEKFNVWKILALLTIVFCVGCAGPKPNAGASTGDATSGAGTGTGGEATSAGTGDATSGAGTGTGGTTEK